MLLSAEMMIDFAPPALYELWEQLLAAEWYPLAFYLALAAFAGAALFLLLERLARVRRRRIVPRRFTERLEQMIEYHVDTGEHLTQLCEKSPSPVARVLRAGITRAGAPFGEVERAMRDVAGREATILGARTAALRVVGSSAIALGFLGTIVGGILALRVSPDLARLPVSQLADGLALTGIGLTISAVCRLAAAWFGHRLQRLMSELADTIELTIPAFRRMEDAPLCSHGQTDHSADRQQQTTADDDAAFKIPGATEKRRARPAKGWIEAAPGPVVVPRQRRPQHG